MNTIPYYDVDNRLIAFLTLPKAEVYVRDGIATAVRSGKAGPLRRLYRKTAERIFTSPSEVSFAANSTTERLRFDGGAIFAGPRIREHRPAQKPSPLTVINQKKGGDFHAGMPAVSTIGYDLRAKSESLASNRETQELSAQIERKKTRDKVKSDNRLLPEVLR